MMQTQRLYIGDEVYFARGLQCRGRTFAPRARVFGTQRCMRLAVVFVPVFFVIFQNLGASVSRREAIDQRRSPEVRL